MAIKKLAFPPTIWRPVLLKTGGTCTYCGKRLDKDKYGACSPHPPDDDAWEVDHWVPKSTFKTEAEANVPDNLWPACCRCNDEKGNRRGEVYMVERNKKQLSVNKCDAVAAKLKAAAGKPQ